MYHTTQHNRLSDMIDTIMSPYSKLRRVYYEGGMWFNVPYLTCLFKVWNREWYVCDALHSSLGDKENTLVYHRMV